MKGPKGPLPCYVGTQPLCGLVDNLRILGREAIRKKREARAMLATKGGPALGAGPLHWRKRPQSASGVLVSHGLDPQYNRRSGA